MVKEDLIRLAKSEDAAGILEIYSYYVNNTVVTFEMVPPDLKEMERRISEYSNSYYWIVYEEEGKILGYSYYSRHRERKAYYYTCETTVYVHHEHLNKGIGHILYKKLIENLQQSRMAVAIAVIALPNEGSVRLHEKFGFKKAGILHCVGRKFNKWIDTGFWELELKDFSAYEP